VGGSILGHQNKFPHTHPLCVQIQRQIRKQFSDSPTQPQPIKYSHWLHGVQQIFGCAKGCPRWVLDPHSNPPWRRRRVKVTSARTKYFWNILSWRPLFDPQSARQAKRRSSNKQHRLWPVLCTWQAVNRHRYSGRTKWFMITENFMSELGKKQSPTTRFVS